MNLEPLHEGDDTDRQVDAARRVLVDVGQALASVRDAIVVVCGWVPDLLVPDAERFYFSGGNICARRAAAA